MFKRIKWGAYAPLNNLPKEEDFNLLEKVIIHCFPTCRIDRESKKACELLEYGVITLVDGRDVEHYSYERLIYHLLPYVAFSNNLYYVRGYRNSILQAQDPIKTLIWQIERYNTKFLNKTNFHL